jgi:hypothetical protein
MGCLGDSRALSVKFHVELGLIIYDVFAQKGEDTARAVKIAKLAAVDMMVIQSAMNG